MSRPAFNFENTTTGSTVLVRGSSFRVPSPVAEVAVNFSTQISVRVGLFTIGTPFVKLSLPANRATNSASAAAAAARATHSAVRGLAPAAATMHRDGRLSL